MAVDGTAEHDAIFARLMTLAGGRGFDGGVPDDDQIVREADGTAKPYWVLLSGIAIPTARDRGMGVSEAGQPHLLPYTVTAYSGSRDNTAALSVAIVNKMLGWVPTATNSGELKINGGHTYQRRATELHPSVWESSVALVCHTNLSTP